MERTANNVVVTRVVGAGLILVLVGFQAWTGSNLVEVKERVGCVEVTAEAIKERVEKVEDKLNRLVEQP